MEDLLNDPWVEAIEADEDELSLAEANVGLPHVVATEADAGVHPIVLARHTRVGLGEPPVEAARAPKRGRSVGRSAVTRDASEAELAAGGAVVAAAGLDEPRVSVDGPGAVPDSVPALAARASEVALANPEPPRPAPITSADFDGSFRFVGGQTQREQVADAIEATVESLPRLFHRIARKRLTIANPIDERVEVRVVGDQITVEFASGFRYSCSLDGSSAQSKGAEGQRLEVRVRTKGSKLVHLVNSKEGAGMMVFVLSPDRKRLTIHHKVSSPRLPVPVSYRLSYTRS